MNKTKCIFKPQRCKKCDNLILKNETDHICKEKPTLRFPHSRRLDLEIWGVFDHLKRKSLRPSEIAKYLKSEFPQREYDKFDIKWHMKTLPKTYAVDETISQNKYAEKYYFQINNEKSAQIQKLHTITSYYVNPPRTRWGIVYGIKKKTIINNHETITTLAMVYGEKLAESLLKKCKELKA